MERTIEVIKEVDTNLLIRFPNGAEFLVSKVEFYEVFELVSGNTYKLKVDIDKFTEEQIKEIIQMLPLAIIARDEGRKEDVEELSRIAEEFCKKYNIPEELLQLSLKVAEATIPRSK